MHCFAHWSYVQSVTYCSAFLLVQQEPYLKYPCKHHHILLRLRKRSRTRLFHFRKESLCLDIRTSERTPRHLVHIESSHIYCSLLDHQIICDFLHEARIRSHVNSTNALSWLKNTIIASTMSQEQTMDQHNTNLTIQLTKIIYKEIATYLQIHSLVILTFLQINSHRNKKKCVHKGHDVRRIQNLSRKWIQATQILAQSKAKIAEQKAAVKKTHTKGLGDWKEWTEFIPTYSIKNDPFLQRFKSDEGYQINDVFQAYLVKYRADSFGMIISVDIGEARLWQGLSNICTRFKVQV